MHNKLRVLRAGRRISQMALAAEVRKRISGFTRDRLWRIENEFTEPSQDERTAICAVLDCSESDAFPELAAASASTEEGSAR